MKLLLSLILLLSSCNQFQFEDKDRELLTLLIKSDMQAIVTDVETTILLEEPYFTITRWKRYEKGDYKYLAEVDFFFLNPQELNSKIVRKYRYNRIHKKWERYYNEYHTIHEDE